VFTRRIALDVAAYQASRELQGYFMVLATAAPGHRLGEIHDAILAEIDRVAEAGPTDLEMNRGRVQAEAQFVYRLQTVGGFNGKSDQLNAYNVFRGDPDFFAADLHRYQAADAESVRRAVSEYVYRVPPVALSVVPRGQMQLALERSSRVDVS
jgi:zinc protease